MLMKYKYHKLITNETMRGINRWSKSGKSSALIRCSTDSALLAVFSCEKNVKNVYEVLEYIIEGEIKGCKK